MQTNFQKKLEALSKRVEIKYNEIRNPIPKILYHYTDAKGLKGILESKVIYLTNSNYLNDSSELEQGWKITEEIIKKYIKKEDNKTWSESLERILTEGNPLKKFYEVFIASFCKEDDLLNQWRGYGSTDGAFSIGIKTSKLKKKKQLGKVEYSEPPPTGVGGI